MEAAANEGDADGGLQEAAAPPAAPKAEGVPDALADHVGARPQAERDGPAHFPPPPPPLP
eukprot:1134762-Pyramimonas_sp.AAC.1